MRCEGRRTHWGVSLWGDKRTGLIDGETLLRIIEEYDANDIVEWYCRGKPAGGL